MDKVTLAEKRLSGTCLVCDLSIISHTDVFWPTRERDAEILCKWHYQRGIVLEDPTGLLYYSYDHVGVDCE